MSLNWLDLKDDEKDVWEYIGYKGSHGCLLSSPKSWSRLDHIVHYDLEVKYADFCVSCDHKLKSFKKQVRCSYCNEVSYLNYKFEEFLEKENCELLKGDVKNKIGQKDKEGYYIAEGDWQMWSDEHPLNQYGDCHNCGISLRSWSKRAWCPKCGTCNRLT